MFWPSLKCHILSFKTVVGQLCKFHITNDERLVSKWKVKLFFSRRLKQFDGLTWLTLTPLFYDRSTPLSRRIKDCDRPSQTTVGCRPDVTSHFFNGVQPVGVSAARNGWTLGLRKTCCRKLSRRSFETTSSRYKGTLWRLQEATENF